MPWPNRRMPSRESTNTSPIARRVLSALLVAAAAATFVAGPAAAQAPSEPEARLRSLVNEARASVGRVPLRWDGRLADVAQDRSDVMAQKRLFGHIDGSKLAAMIDAKGIVWSYLAETLSKTPPGPAMAAADVAMGTWRTSKSHWDLLTNAEFNYVGIGVARDGDGWYYWTALLLKGPDRTAPVATMSDAQLGPVSSGKRSVTLWWTGADVMLSSLTSGLRDFRLQRQIGSGSWEPATGWTTGTSATFSLPVGRTYHFRVRARDWNGNRSAWSAELTVNP